MATDHRHLSFFSRVLFCDKCKKTCVSYISVSYLCTITGVIMYLRVFVYVADLEARMFFPAALTPFLLLTFISPAKANVIFLH